MSYLIGKCLNTNTSCATRSRRDKCKCESCLQYKRDYQRDYRKRHPEKHLKYLRKRDGKVRHRREILKKYGLSEQDYETLKKSQNNVCAICLQECKTGRRLAIDHCHETGEVRGLLCTKCNQGIGQFDEDPKLLFRAVRYIKSSLP